MRTRLSELCAPFSALICASVLICPSSFSQDQPDASAITQFADALGAAPSKAARDQLFAQSKELLKRAVLNVLLPRADALTEAGKIEDATRLAELGLEAGKFLPDKLVLAASSRCLGTVFYKQYNYAEAAEWHQHALSLHREIGNQKGVAAALLNLGNVHAAKNEYAEALKLYAESLATARQIPDASAEGRALHRIGEVYRQQMKFPEALAKFQECLRLTPGTNRGEIADTKNSIANICFSTGKLAEAERIFDENLALYREISDPEGEAMTLGNLGVVYESTGRYALAMETDLLDLALKRQIRDKLGEVMTLNNIGVIHLLSGSYRPALDRFQESLALAEAIGDPAGQARAFHNLGGVHEMTGRYGVAIRWYERSLEIERRLGDQQGAAQSLGSIANINKLAGNYDEALAGFEAVLKVFQRLGLKKDEAVTYHNIGSVFAAMKDIPKAVEHLEQSLNLKREIQDKAGEAVTLNNLGAVSVTSSRLDDAQRYFEACLRLARGQGNKPEIAKALLGMGDVLVLRNQLEDALEKYQEALKLAEEMDDLEVRVYAHLGIAEVHLAKSQFNQAAGSYRKSIAAIEQLRTEAAEPAMQIGVFGEHAKPFQQLIRCFLAMQRTEEAWQVAEQAKSRSLVDLLSTAKLDINQAMSPEEKGLQAELNQRIVFANLELRRLHSQPNANSNRLAQVAGRLGTARSEYDGFRQKLYLNHSDLSIKRGELRPISLSEVSRALGEPDTAVLEFVVGADESYVFVLHRSSNARLGAPSSQSEINLSAYTIKVKQSELARLVSHLRTRLVNLSLRPNFPEAQSLYELLIAPVAAQLVAAKTICIVPDGVLWEVPFHALTDSAGKYLIRDHAIFYAPSLTALQSMTTLAQQHRLRARSAPDGNLLVMANPELGATRKALAPLLGGFDAIPGTEKQGREIATLFGTNAQIFLGNEATEHRAKTESPHHRILHFATHGVFEPNSPLYSGLLFTPDVAGPEDGYWEAREIMDANLNAELVVLSACETARGKIRSGEGILGLSWAFFVANCPSIVVSQWEVADESTSALMVEFYRQLKPTLSDAIAGAGQSPATITIAEALRQAQLALLRTEQWQHPFYWAPFILIGNWR